MTTLGELLKDSYTTIAESETFIHLRNEKRQNILYSRKTGTYIPFTIDSRQTKLYRVKPDNGSLEVSTPKAETESAVRRDKTADDTLQAIRDYDGWGATE